MVFGLSINDYLKLIKGGVINGLSFNTSEELDVEYASCDLLTVCGGEYAMWLLLHVPVTCELGRMRMLVSTDDIKKKSGFFTPAIPLPLEDSVRDYSIDDLIAYLEKRKAHNDKVVMDVGLA